MGWHIRCTDSACGCEARADNIVSLILEHRAADGYFRSSCGRAGYVEKSFALQEQGETWDPYLRGVIELGRPGDVYQPFVFLVSY
jgi:hypothetical protein